MREAKRLLIVDADAQMRLAMQAMLEAEGYLVSVAADDNQMQQTLMERCFDLITLDLALPGTAGLRQVRDLCLATDTPVMVVTARADDYDRIIALEFGADDYVVKPFHPRELTARVGAVLRRSAKAMRRQSAARSVTASVIAFHDYQLNTQTRKLAHASGVTTALTVAECRLLEVLIQHSGQACTRDEITERIKGRRWSPLDRSLDTLVARLRRKIEPDPDQPALLMSVRGVGYMMTVSTGHG
jgi:two-component system, OmpR family, response regulator